MPLNLINRGTEIKGPAFAEIARSVLFKNARLRFRAKGSSMHPFIKNGDVVTIYPLMGKSPGFGDVVAFVNPQTEQLVVHRVIGKQKNFLYLMGDNLNNPDGLIPASHILGILKKLERNGKKVILGFGWERYLIAYFISRKKALSFIYSVLKSFRPIITRFRIG